MLALLGAGQGTNSTATPGASLNPADASPLARFSNGNLTMGVAANGGTAVHTVARSTTHKTSGKYHIELTVNNLTRNVGLGFALSAFPLNTGSYLGADGNAIGFFDDGFVGYSGGSGTSGFPTFGTGAIVAADIDTAIRMIWFSINGTSITGNPVAGTGGFDVGGTMTDFYFAVDMQLQGDSATVNFGATSFAHPTSGFGAWT